MVVHVVLRPGVSPATRAEVEDAVCAALGDDAELLGGGTLLERDGSPVESDFDVELSDDRDEDEILACVERALRASVQPPTSYTFDVLDLPEDDDD